MALANPLNKHALNVIDSTGEISMASDDGDDGNFESWQSITSFLSIVKYVPLTHFP